MRFSIRSCLAPFLLLAGCLGEETLVPRSSGDLCGFTEGRTVLLGNLVFLMAGKVTIQDGHNEAFVNQLYWLDLNTTFNVEGGISPNTLHNTDIPSSAPHEFSGGAFLAAQNSIYIYAGLGSSNRYDWMWSYNAEDGTWSRATVAGGKLNLGKRFAGLSAIAPESNLSFYTGGWDMPITGTLVFNATDSADLQWTNVTKVEGNDAVGEPRIANGGMEYVRLGKNGILVAFGGYDTSKKGTNTTATSQDLRAMDKIGVYDIDSRTWYEIGATGDIPKPRTAFCTAVSSAPDDSSFQVHMYGGRSRTIENATSYNDLYVLTLPSFRWIRAPTTGLEPWKADGVGRDSHKCVTWKDGEMVVIGGTTRKDDKVQKGCSRNYPPIRVLDTSNFRWEKQFERETTYSVPRVVSDVVGGDGTGKATLKEPEGGWPNSQLEHIFSQTVSRKPEITEKPLPSEPTGTSQPITPPSSKKSSNAGAIAGGVVGGVGGVAVIAGAIFFLRRSKRKKNTGDRFNASPAVPTAPSVYYPEPDSSQPVLTDKKDSPYMRVEQRPRELSAQTEVPSRYELESQSEGRPTPVFELDSPMSPPQPRKE
ncbi:kelch repeat protein [Histoplasma ohiense]|nr:kelch repeat protein [Histoplasma ohiense (nom. inval.)]